MEELEQVLLQQSNRRIRQQPYGYIYDIFYLGAIGHPSEYVDDIHILQNASPQDLIRIHLNSEGGQLNTLIQLVNAIRSCQGTVLTILESEAHSAAGALFLAGDQFQVGTHAAMLIHEPSGGNWDYHSKSKKYQEFSAKHSEDVFADFYEGFLSEEEINDVLDGKDLWLDSDEIENRLESKCKGSEEEPTEEKPLEECTKEELYLICETLQIKFKAKDNKNKLIELIYKHS